MARPLCKWSYQVEHAHDVPQALRRAFKVAAELLLGARNPMILVGDRVAVSGAQAVVVALAELLGAALFENYASAYNAPTAHPLNLGMFSFAGGSKHLEATLADSDVLLCVG